MYVRTHSGIVISIHRTYNQIYNIHTSNIPLNWIDTKKNVSFNKKLNHFSISIFHTTHIYADTAMKRDEKCFDRQEYDSANYSGNPVILMSFCHCLSYLRVKNLLFTKKHFPLWYFAGSSSLSISYIILTLCRLKSNISQVKSPFQTIVSIDLSSNCRFFTIRYQHCLATLQP